MRVIHSNDVKRLAKRLKRILQEEYDEETRLGQCQHVVAEAFDFDDFGHLMRELPTQARWHRDWCINALCDEGYVQREDSARGAVQRLEETFGSLIEGRPPPDPVDQPESLYR